MDFLSNPKRDDRRCKRDDSHSGSVMNPTSLRQVCDVWGWLKSTQKLVQSTGPGRRNPYSVLVSSFGSSVVQTSRTRKQDWLHKSRILLEFLVKRKKWAPLQASVIPPYCNVLDQQPPTQTKWSAPSRSQTRHRTATTHSDQQCLLQREGVPCWQGP